MLREFHHDRRTLDAFGDHEHLRYDVIDAAALAQLDTDMTVAALRAGTGRHQIPDARQACKRRRLASHRDAEASDFCESAGYHGCPRVVAGPLPVAHAYGDGHHVLQNAAQLAADHV